MEEIGHFRHYIEPQSDDKQPGAITISRSEASLHYNFVKPISYLNVLRGDNKKVGDFARLAEGKASDWVIALMQDLGLTMSVSCDVPFCKHNTSICKTC